jgi:chromosomal replication initiator protein
MVQEALSDLDRIHVQPIRPETIVEIACEYFGVIHKDILSSRREHGISMPRSVAMYLVRKITQLSYPEIGHLLNKKNHSTVISACNRIDQAVREKDMLEWIHPLGPRKEEAGEVIQRLEELCRNGKPA